MLSYKTTEEVFEAINKFVLYNYNFNTDFIDEIWSGNFAKHFKAKWKLYYDQAGENGVLTLFYVNLDGGNRKLLIEYIMNNFKG